MKGSGNQRHSQHQVEGVYDDTHLWTHFVRYWALLKKNWNDRFLKIKIKYSEKYKTLK